MKKLSVLAIAFAAIAFAACGGKKSAQAVEDADSLKSFEQQQIEASIKMHLDSISADLGKLDQLPFLQEKYRVLSALNVDRKIAAMYEMPTEDYDKAITKLAADIDDPSFKAIEDANTIYETTNTLYDAMNDNGRINYFWQLASASLVEQLYVTNQNADKFLSVFNDEAAANVTFRIVLILDAINRLTDFDPEIKPVASALAPLDVLNATTVSELKAQLAEAKDKIAAAREALVK